MTKCDFVLQELMKHCNLKLPFRVLIQHHLSSVCVCGGGGGVCVCVGGGGTQTLLGLAYAGGTSDKTPYLRGSYLTVENTLSGTIWFKIFMPIKVT